MLILIDKCKGITNTPQKLPVFRKKFLSYNTRPKDLIVISDDLMNPCNCQLYLTTFLLWLCSLGLWGYAVCNADKLEVLNKGILNVILQGYSSSCNLL